MQKTQSKGRHRLRRLVVAGLAVLVIAGLTVAASALLREKEAPAAAQGDEGAPIAQNQSIRVYRDVPYDGTFTVSGDASGLTFALQTEPESGTVTIGEGTADFRYIPKEGKTGADRFTFVAVDAQGRVSAPATVEVDIVRGKSGVTYADMDANAAHTAALDLAEADILTGTKVGERYFFEPEKTVTRSEFLTMAMKAIGSEPLADVGVTGFSDDSEIPTWAKSTAASALAQGLLDDTAMVFGADTPETVGEAAAVLDRMLKLTDVPLTEASEAQQAMANLESVGVCLGSATTETGLRRAEAAQLLSGAMKVAESGETSFWDFLAD
jgi:hypothetical protein